LKPIQLQVFSDREAPSEDAVYVWPQSANFYVDVVVDYQNRAKGFHISAYYEL
jgi:hypothetical protein